MSPELSVRVDEWIRRNTEGTDLNFTLELENQDWLLLKEINL